MDGSQPLLELVNDQALLLQRVHHAWGPGRFADQGGWGACCLFCMIEVDYRQLITGSSDSYIAIPTYSVNMT